MKNKHYSSMNYYIGLDGGGTKTKLVLTDQHLNVLCEKNGGPSTFILIGTDKVCEMLWQILTSAVEECGLDPSEIRGVLIGTTGAGRRSDAESLENAFDLFNKTNGNLFPNFRVESDARIALEGAFSGKPGSILIAGTGSIMFGKDNLGNIHRIGGYGRFIGDEGSGYMLGKRGLIAVANDYDGRDIKTSLTKLIAETFGITDPATLITEIYKNNFDIAAVAPLVIKCAHSGDELCMQIIDEEIDSLIKHIRAMSIKLNEKKMNISLIGGLITTDNFYANLFRQKISDILTNVIMKDPDYSPAIGAAIMAKAYFH